MGSSANTGYQVVEMERTKETGIGQMIRFGVITPNTTTPTPVFCLQFMKTGWEFVMDSHYCPHTIRLIASNGAQMGLSDLIKLARNHAATKYPNG